jgi:uncharacterized protein (DUF697 family)
MGYADTLRRVMEGDYAGASAEEKQRAVADVVQVCSVAAAAVSIQPFPLLDVALVTPIQIGMVQAIGRVHGHSLDRKSILEILGTFGASIVAQNVMMAAAKFVPFAGWIVASSMAYALTWAIGEVSEHYFRNGRGVPQDELRTMFRRVYEQKKTEKQRQHEGDTTLKERLEQLRQAHQAGLLSEEEFMRKKEEILGSF